MTESARTQTPSAETIQPALTPEEWAYFTSGGIQKHVIQYAIEAAELDRAHDLSSHSLAALALYGEPFGFTREDVADELNAAMYFEAEAICAEREGLDDGVREFTASARRHHARAARIAALLPPE